MGAKVWAPSVVRSADGKFHMLVSVGSEVWSGVADHPLGTWKNVLGDRPLIPATFNKAYHMIDAEAFVDDDGTPYLHWGSGWNWVNGRCFAARLKPDFSGLDGEARDVTPANYFEAPFLVKHAGKYYLTYSQGNTTKDTYQVHYAVGDCPLGPFTEASNSPILVTDKELNVVGPGHHAIFTEGGKSYILYHRHSVPFDPKNTVRQLCVDPLEFTANGLISKVKPTHEGPELIRGRLSARPPLPATATASSQAGELNGPERLGDDNFATRWAAARDAKGGWVRLDFGKTVSVSRQEIRPEFAWKTLRFKAEASKDGEAWETVADHLSAPVSGSPIVLETAKPLEARHLRLSFPAEAPGADLSLFEWQAFPCVAPN